MGAIRLITWIALSFAGRLAASTAVAAALGIHHPFAAAMVIVPALEVAGTIPLTPGNVGITSGAIALAFHTQGVSFTHGLAAGIAFHAVETAVGIMFGIAQRRLARALPHPRVPPRRPALHRCELDPRDRRRLQRDSARAPRLVWVNRVMSDPVKAVRALVVVCALALLLAEHAGAQTSSDFVGHHNQVFRVVIVNDLTTGDLPKLAQFGAVGLVVPNAGPKTSAADAFAGMVRGILYNTRLAWPRKDAVLIHVQKTSTIPLSGPVIVIGMPPATRVANDHRYPIAVIGRGYHGLLHSSLTRVPGLVSIADVARTALQTPHMLTAQRDSNAPRTVERLESHIGVARNSTMAASVLVMGLLVLFALFFPQGAAAALGAALAANLALGWLLAGSAGPRVALVGAFTVAGGILGARFLRSGTRLGFALVGVVVAYALSMAVHPEALSLAPMGPELTSRFFGVSNLLETLLLAPALIGAKLLTDRFGWRAFVAVALLSLVTIAENQLGSDGGGAIVIGVAFAVLGVAMSGAGWR